jgi:hypothetical protein
MIGFERTRGSFDDYFNSSMIGIEKELDAKQSERLRKIRTAWNYYEGYHWEELPEQDSPELTINYCRAFVDKFVAFELGKAFSMTFSRVLAEKKVTTDGRTLFEYMEDVWEDNNQYLLCTEIGQMKSITSEAWLQAYYEPPTKMKDPFGEYPNGRLRIILHPSNIVFADFDPHDRDRLTKVTLMYSYKRKIRSGILNKEREETVVYKQIWTEDECAIIDGDKTEKYPNKYHVIPFVQIKNLPMAGRTDSRGDLDDIIPMNMEYDMKNSNVSEIIDYHAAPVTIVYGAKIGNLEKGANKMWGGLPKDAKVQNLGLESDLGASNNYINTLKLNMCEVAGIPEAVLGGAQAISNTSGVALQYINLPLVEKTRVKRMSTEDGLERLNKLLILVSMCEGLIKKPDGISNRDFFHTEVDIPDTLPKDELLQLQQIQLEMQLKLESRRGAMRRLGKENIDELIAEIDAEQPPEEKTPPEETPKLNSGFLNSQTAKEQERIEKFGENKEQ